jgi:NhaP-type Na+/H+ or K+/H+ antiporter
MGLQLRGLLDEVDAVHASVATAVGLGALVTLVILAVRLVFVAPLVMMLAKESERAGVVLGWAGMRGAITVAAAQSLPEDFPLRPQVLLVAFTAALLTLLVPGLSLPTVIRALKVPGDDPRADRKQLQDLLAARAGGRYSTRVLRQVERRLDQAEGRMQQLIEMAE